MLIFSLYSAYILASGTVTAPGNATGNSTAFAEHVVFSTLDLMGSCDFIVLVLSIQVCMQPLVSRTHAAAHISYDRGTY